MTDQRMVPADLLVRYMDGATQLRATLAELKDAELDLAQTPKTWTIRQIAHHLVDGDDFWNLILKAALGNCHASIGLAWYWEKPQNKWAQIWNYAGRALEPSLALFEANRRHVQQLIECIPGAWNCGIGIKWNDGDPERRTVGDIVAIQTRHTAKHIAEIQVIRQAHQM